MNAIELLSAQADYAFADLCASLEGIDEPLSWGQIPLQEGQYLHTNGSILGMIQHIASAKLMYASAGFMDGAITWRDVARDFDEIGASWQKSVEYLHLVQKRWMESWHDLDAAALEEMRKKQSGQEWPAWKIITLMSHHDSYHGGQLEMLKSTVKPSNTPPTPLEGDDIRQYCGDSPFW